MAFVRFSNWVRVKLFDDDEVIVHENMHKVFKRFGGVLNNDPVNWLTDFIETASGRHVQDDFKTHLDSFLGRGRP
jgi:hypothetical protein